MITQRDLEIARLDAQVRVQEMLDKFYADFYGKRARRQPRQPAEPQLAPTQQVNDGTVYSQEG